MNGLVLWACVRYGPTALANWDHGSAKTDPPSVLPPEFSGMRSPRPAGNHWQGLDDEEAVSQRILIVEDEIDLVETLSFALKREGYEVETTDSGEAALVMARGSESTPAPDLLLLDLMLPDLSGTEVCRRLRSDGSTAALPVIMLTAKDEEIDRVVGFEVGADDYVTKPFSVRELLLRIRAVLRRSEGRTEAPRVDASSQESMEFGPIRVDVPGHRVWVDADEVALTALEYRLLTTFMTRRGRVQTREVLLADVWNIHADVTTRTVDTHVKRLREKLGTAGKFIETLRGVGYRMASTPSEAVPS